MNRQVDYDADVLIIGGGPGGYVAAIRAAQLGGKVILVERDTVGGTCLNRGCIPTKALLHSTEYLNVPKEAAKAGIEIKYHSINLTKLAENKNNVVRQLVRGVEYLLKENRIEVIKGEGRFISANIVEIASPQGYVRKKAKSVIIATGSKTAALPVPGSHLVQVVNSDQALNPQKIPSSIVIIGGGAVGLEFAFIYRNLGAEVAVVEMMPRLLPQMDTEIVEILEKILTKRSIKVFTAAKMERIEESSKGKVNLALSSPRGSFNLAAEQVMTAVGRVPETSGLNLEEVGIKTGNSKITVNKYMETTVKGVYAIGDAVGGILLAHVASAEGIVAAENALGMKSEMDYKVVPSCIYTAPEMAGVGLTEQTARERGYRIKIGKFPFTALGKAVAIGSSDGQVKIIAEERTGEILGVHIIGERATDLIAEAALAMRLEATVEELTATIHAHPTMAEAISEAAHAAGNRAIHLP